MMSVFQPVVLGIAPPYSQQDGPVWVDTTPDPLSRLARSSTGVLRTEGTRVGGHAVETGGKGQEESPWRYAESRADGAWLDAGSSDPQLSCVRISASRRYQSFRERP